MSSISPHLQQEEESLLRRARQGDLNAYGLLVQMHQKRCYATIAAIAGCERKAETILQATFIDGFHELTSSVAGAQPFWVWLYRTSLKCATHSRSSGRIPAFVADSLKTTSATDPLTTNSRSPTVRDERIRNSLHSAMSQLDTRRRCILVLREVAEFNYDSIASIMQIDYDCVRSELFQARRQLSLSGD